MAQSAMDFLGDAGASPQRGEARPSAADFLGDVGVLSEEQKAGSSDAAPGVLGMLGMQNRDLARPTPGPASALEHIGHAASEAFEAPLGVSEERLQNPERALAGVPLADAATQFAARWGSKVADAVFQRAPFAAWYGLSALASEVAYGLGLPPDDAGRLERDLKAMPEAFMGSPGALGVPRARAPTARDVLQNIAEGKPGQAPRVEPPPLRTGPTVPLYGEPAPPAEARALAPEATAQMSPQARPAAIMPFAEEFLGGPGAGRPATVMPFAERAAEPPKFEHFFDPERMTFGVRDAEGNPVATGFEHPDQAKVAAQALESGTRLSPSSADLAKRAEVDRAAAETDIAPSAAQKAQGNYRKGVVDIDGMKVAIETPKGALRTGVSPEGEPWSVRMRDDYGYIKRSEGADGEGVDAFIGPYPRSSDKAYVIDQVDPETRAFDEHKVVLGARSEAEATRIYDRGFSDGSGPDRRGDITEMRMPEFKQWIETGDTTKPVSPEVPTRAEEAQHVPWFEPEDRGPSLVQFLARQRGVQDFRGELRAMDAHKKFVPGSGMLVRKEGGLPLDYAREAAAQRGYPVGEDIPSFLEAVRQDLSGRRGVYAAMTPEVIRRDQQGRPIERAPIPPGATERIEQAITRRAPPETHPADLGQSPPRTGGAEELLAALGPQEREFRSARPANPEAPTPQGSPGAERLDNVTSAIADAVGGAGAGGKGPGTYERAADRLARAGADIFAQKRLRIGERQAIFPRTLATLDERFGRLYGEFGRQTADQHQLLDSFRQTLPNFLAIKDAAAIKRIAGALELDAYYQNKRPTDGRPLEVYNTASDWMQHTQKGDRYTISDRREIAAYHELVRLGDVQKSSIERGMLNRLLGQKGERFLGPDGHTDLNALAQAARQSRSPSERRHLAGAAEVMTEVSKRWPDVYFPKMRFGDYFIAIKPKAGTDMAALGGFPELAWFDAVERSEGERLGKGLVNAADPSLKGQKIPQAAADRIAELRQRFPADKFDIETGDLKRRADVLRNLNIPAVEKLMWLMEQKATDRYIKDVFARQAIPEEGLSPKELRAMKAQVAQYNQRGQLIGGEAHERYQQMTGDMVEAFRSAMYGEMKAPFKRAAKWVPGYSDDFERTLGTHAFQVARNASEMTHRDAVDTAYQDIIDNHPNRNVRNFTQQWMDYQRNPDEPFSRTANVSANLGFAWTMAANPSSTAVFALHTPFASGPALMAAAGPRALPRLAGALREAWSGVTMDRKRGFSIDIDKLGRTVPEKAFLARVNAEGLLHSIGADDLRALNDRQAGLWRESAGVMRRALDIAGSNISVADQANRAGLALAAYRLANEPKAMQRMMSTMGEHSALFRDMVQTEGATPETVARFMLRQAAFDWGRENRPEMMRNAGRMVFALHGFQARYLSEAFNLMKNMGPPGWKALGLMMASLWAGAGFDGLPFTQDLENLGDKAYKWITGKDPMLHERLRAFLADDLHLGKIGAQIALRGPLGTMLGVDLTNRIGFGDVVSRELSRGEMVLTTPSILLQRLAAVHDRLASRQGTESATAEVLPSALRNPLRAAIESETGAKTVRSGKTTTSATRIPPQDTAKRALGFQPMSRELSYERYEYGQRAKAAKMRPPKNEIPPP